VGLSRRHLLVAGGVGLLAALALAAAVSLRAGWGLLAGIGIGAATLSGLGALSLAFSETAGGGARLIIGALHLIKYPLILLVLYLLVVPVHADVVWLCIGYTGALVVFLAGQTTRGRVKNDGAPADKQ
jgi:hypothetical protein